MFKNTSMEKAFYVLAAVNSKLSCGSSQEQFGLQAFSNCREQGFCLIGHPVSLPCSLLQVAFSENRNSDQIVVYYGNSMQFDISTNHPRNWEQKRYFPYNGFEQAADFIIKYLRTGDVA